MNAESEIWDHLASTVLKSYVLNTVLLVLGVGGICAVIGILCAWLVTVFSFPGRKLFQWALILPLAIPAYIAAYTYAGIFDYTNPIQSYTMEFLNIKQQYVDIMSMRNLVLILGVNLYPYVYLITRASFVRQSQTSIEAARILGSSPFNTFFRITLPLARPAIAGGLMLVIMELLNDYGAMKYFGVNTFTTAICQVWFSLGDINTAIRLSIVLIAITLLFVGIERIMRKGARYSMQGSMFRPVQKIRLKGYKALFAFVVCFIPLLFGFLIPTSQIIIWAVSTAGTVLNAVFFSLIYNSFTLAFWSSLGAIIVGLIIVYAVRLRPGVIMKWLLRSSTLGYAMPGAVIAIGVMVPFIFIHNGLAESFGSSYDGLKGLATGGMIALGFAYVVRFLALAVNPIESGFEKIGKAIEEASRTLGKNPLRTLLLIDIPLLRGAIVAAAVFVFVNVLKELPLTIILRPFNMETLATRSFDMATNEMIPESSWFALVIILVSVIPVLVLNRFASAKK